MYSSYVLKVYTAIIIYYYFVKNEVTVPFNVMFEVNPDSQ